MSSFRDQVEANRPNLETEADRLAQSAQLFEEEAQRAENMIRKAVLHEASKVAKGQQLKVSMFLHSYLYFELHGTSFEPERKRNKTNKSLFVNVEGINQESGLIFKSKTITHHFELTEKAEQLRSRLRERMKSDGFTFGEWGILPCSFFPDSINSTREYWIDGVCDSNFSDLLPFPLTTIEDLQSQNRKLHCISRGRGIDKYINDKVLKMVLPFCFT